MSLNPLVPVRARISSGPRATSLRDRRFVVETAPASDGWAPGQSALVRWGRHLVPRPFDIIDWRARNARDTVWLLQLGLRVDADENLQDILRVGTAVDLVAPVGLGLSAAATADPSMRALFVSVGAGATAVFSLFEARKRVQMKLHGADPDRWLHFESTSDELDRELMARSYAFPSQVVFAPFDATSIGHARGLGAGFTHLFLAGGDRAHAETLAAAFEVPAELVYLHHLAPLAARLSLDGLSNGAWRSLATLGALP